MEVYDKTLRYYLTMGDGLGAFPNINVCGHLWRAVVTLVLHRACCGCGDTDHCYWGLAKLGRQAFSSCRSHQGCYYYYFDSANLNKQWQKRFSLISAFACKFGPNHFKMDQSGDRFIKRPPTHKQGTTACTGWIGDMFVSKIIPAGTHEKNACLSLPEELNYEGQRRSLTLDAAGLLPVRSGRISWAWTVLPFPRLSLNIGNSAFRKAVSD